MTRQEVTNQENQNMIALIDQSGVESAIGKILNTNKSIVYSPVSGALSDRIEQIKNGAGFYIANRKDLMALPKDSKLQMLYGVLKEAMVGCEAGTDYDIVPFKGKPVVCRKKEGWFKVINMIKPAEILRFVVNVIFEGDDYKFNPVTEELTHESNIDSDKYEDIVGAYAYIKFANGFEKMVFMKKKDIDKIRKMSPSASSAFSPWTTMPIKMVKTKVTKELAKELFTLFSGNINPMVANAIAKDEVPVAQIDVNGNIDEAPIVIEPEYDGQIVEDIPQVEMTNIEEL